ncbi:putative ammonium transporter AmtB-like domain, ammonium/urea transporter [Helianthus annuus]|nr:putative ammonium transporter AmtB-like domain, ammonium/urea transporter [Helianthus annuus]
MKILSPYESGSYYGQWTAVGRTAVTTTLAGCTAALTTFLGKELFQGVTNWLKSTSTTTHWKPLSSMGVAGRGGLYSRPYSLRRSMLMRFTRGNRVGGLFMGGGGKLSGVHMVQILVIFGFMSATMGPLFFILHKLKLLRISPEDETTVMDMTRHGGFAYVYHDEDGIPMKKIEPASSS